MKSHAAGSSKLVCIDTFCHQQSGQSTPGEVRTLPTLTGGKAAGIAGRGNTETPSAWIRVYKDSPAAGEVQGAQAGRWAVVLADTPRSAGASYSYGRKLYHQLRIPIGVIESPAGP